MKKVVVIHENGIMTGGSAQIAIQTAIGLASIGINVTYFCAIEPIDPKLKEAVDNVICLNQKDIANDTYKIRAISNGLWNRKAYNSLNNLLKEYGTETIVHIHGWTHALSTSIFKACKDNSITPFVTLHDYFCVCPNGGFYNYQNNCICTFQPMSKQCKKCNCDSRSYKHKIFRVMRQVVQDKYVKNNANISYIYISKFSLSKVKNYLKSNNFIYLHNPIDSYQMDMVDSKNNDNFLYIGRIAPEKGVDIFCKAASQLGVYGIVIGDGLLKEKLSKEYPQIKFVGWKSKQEIIPYIKEARCLIFPSKGYEGAPLTTEECLNVGVPCIVSDKCAAVDQIEDGVNGYIFKSEDVEDLKNKITIVNKSSNLFDTENWEIKKYTLQNYINDLIKIYFAE